MHSRMMSVVAVLLPSWLEHVVPMTFGSRMIDRHDLLACPSVMPCDEERVAGFSKFEMSPSFTSLRQIVHTLKFTTGFRQTNNGSRHERGLS